uniref:Sas10 domain-containing protein n=1 Tax=Parastrongyloides trichosuri TaxID=131310 RepID=A0A0N4Z7Q1_PARTI
MVFKGKKSRTPSKKAPLKEEDAVTHLSDEEIDEAGHEEKDEYKDRIPEDLSLELKESKSTKQKLLKNVMIFNEIDSDDSDENEDEEEENKIDVASDENKSFLDSLDDVQKNIVSDIITVDNVLVLMTYFLFKLDKESTLYQVMNFYRNVGIGAKSYLSFKLFGIVKRDGDVGDSDYKRIMENDVEKIKIFFDIASSFMSEIETVIQMMEEQNEEALSESINILNKADCNELWHVLESNDLVGDDEDESEKELCSDSEGMDSDLEDMLKEQDVDEDVKQEVIEAPKERRIDKKVIENKGHVPDKTKKKKKIPIAKRRDQFYKASQRNHSAVPQVRKEITKHGGEARGIKKTVVKSRKF